MLASLVLLSASFAAGSDGFTPLFNGKDLAGWQAFGRAAKDGPTRPIDPATTWTVSDGILKGNGKPTGFLITEKEYDNYVLKLKWRYPKNLKVGLSGVLIHCQKENRVWPVCVEAQLRSGRAGDLWLQTAAEVKLTVDDARRDAQDKTRRHIWRSPKDENIEKPFGEWNEYEIACRGGSITVVVNGKRVNEGTDCNLRKGRIALQAESTEIEFKDIAIRKVKE